MDKYKFETLPKIKNDRVIVWSGGYDSTLILLNELINYGCAVCWTFKFKGYSQEKYKKEEECRNKFKKWAKTKGWKIQHEKIEVQSTIYPKGLLPQQYHWINLLLAYGGNDTKFILGFHLRDYFFQYKCNYLNILKETNVCMNKNIKLEFPFEFKDKWEIVRDVRENGIEKFVWTCEGIEKGNKPCGVCTPCNILRICNSEIEYNKNLEIKNVD